MDKEELRRKIHEAIAEMLSHTLAESMNFHPTIDKMLDVNEEPDKVMLGVALQYLCHITASNISAISIGTKDNGKLIKEAFLQQLDLYIKDTDEIVNKLKKVSKPTSGSSSNGGILH